MQNYVLPGSAYTDLNSLLQLQNLVKRLNILKPPKKRHTLSGSKATAYHGQGLSFAEVRAYQEGDDVRAIDWKVTARKGSSYTKIFHQEQALPYLIIVDQSSSLFFGSQFCFKSVVAAQIAALVGWSVLANHHSLASIVCSDTQSLYLPLNFRSSSALGMITHMHKLNNQLRRCSGENGLQQALEQAVRWVKSGWRVVIISDFMHFGATSIEMLQQLKRKAKLSTVMVYDKLEAELPRSGYLSFTDAKQTYHIDSEAKITRKNYQDLFKLRVESVQKVVDKLNTPLSLIPTHIHTLSNLITQLNIS